MEAKDYLRIISKDIHRTIVATVDDEGLPVTAAIVEVKSGAGSKAGWGRLKSGIGWVSLDFCKRV